jgi:hypothetical protein
VLQHSCVATGAAQGEHKSIICVLYGCVPAALQTLYNHSSPRIVSQLLSQWHAQPADQHNHSPALTAEAADVLAEASGTGSFNRQHPDNTAVQPRAAAAHHQATASSAASREQQGPASVLQHASGAVLLQVAVADCGSCTTFGQLFDWLLYQRGMVACGLYRQTKHQGRRLQYVYTNPDKVRGCICITWPERTTNAYKFNAQHAWQASCTQGA